MTKRKLQAIETRNAIYNAAIELMDELGFDTMTIVDISERAGVSVGSFYHYFESKLDILAEIFRKADDYFLENVAGKLESRSTRERIVEFFMHYARFNVLTSVETASQLYNPKVKFFTHEDRPMLTLLRDIIQEGAETGQIRGHTDVAELVRLFFMLARGVVFDWCLHDGSYDLESTMRDSISLLANSIEFN